MAQHTASAKAKLQERREQVAALALVGATQRQIAERLGVSVGTINRDLTVVKDDWRNQAQSHIMELVGREAASLDRLERDLWRDFVSTDDIGERVKVAGAILRAKDRRAKLFGLDAPDRIELVAQDAVIVIDLGDLG